MNRKLILYIATSVDGYIAPYAIVGGNPAVEIRRRFSEEKIQKVLEMKWWDWPVEEITKHVQLLTSHEVDELYAMHQSKI